MPMIIKRIRDGGFIATLKVLPGYRGITFTTDPAAALRVTDDQAARLCDFDFFGEPVGKYGTAQFERVEVK